MLPQTCAAVWRELLPAGTCISEGEVHGAAGVQGLDEPSLGAIGSDRLRDFAAGRLHTRRALEQLGLRVDGLAAGRDRAPIWPAGVTGSITHASRRGRTYAAAAVQWSSRVRAIGIDAEYETAVEPRLWDLILTARERQTVLSLAVPLRSTAVLMLWCAKEAVVKASGVPRDPTSIDVDRTSQQTRFMARLLLPLPDEPATWHGGVRAADGRILAAVSDPPVSVELG